MILANYFAGLALIALYVNELLNAAPSSPVLFAIKKYLLSIYSMKDLSSVIRFLGMTISKSSKYITLDLREYIISNIQSLHIPTYKQVPTPITSIEPLFDLKSLPVSKITEYRSIVGKLLFAVNIGRPDISCAVSILSRFLKDPRHVHLQAATWDFQYLFTTKNYCLQYTIGSPLIIPTFSDAVSTPLVDFPYSTGWYVTQIAVFYKSIICLIVNRVRIYICKCCSKKERMVST